MKRKLLCLALLQCFIGVNAQAATTAEKWQQAEKKDISYGSDATGAGNKTSDGTIFAGYGWSSNKEIGDRKIVIIEDGNVRYKEFNKNTKIKSISKDGKFIVLNTFNSDISSSSYSQIWNSKNDQYIDMLDKTDNDRFYRIDSVTSDGGLAVGQFNNLGGLDSRPSAFLWNTNTGDLTYFKASDDENNLNRHISPEFITSNGRYVTGYTLKYNDDKVRGFIWNIGDEYITMIGEKNEQKETYPYAISSDGSTVVGDSGDSNNAQAFVWHQGEEKVTILGTFKSDNSGESVAWSVSEDGSVVAGFAESDEVSSRAFVWQTGDTQLTDLGTLRADNSGKSEGLYVSEDGKTILGGAETDDGKFHATIWRLKGSTDSTNNLVDITKIDAVNSSIAMAHTANTGFKVLDLYQSSLNQLNSSRCQIGQDQYCVGVFTQYDSVKNNHRMATGLFGAARLPDSHFTVGGAINVGHSNSFDDHYSATGSKKPGIGLFSRYQENENGLGWNAEASGVYLSQGVRITREKLPNTEIGAGKSKIKGYQIGIGTEYGIALNQDTTISPSVALNYTNLKRDAYTEDNDVALPAQYGQFGNKRTALQVGANIDHQVNQDISLHGELGLNAKLSGKRDAFTGSIPYIGAFAYDQGKERKVGAYVNAGLGVHLSKESTLNFNAGWEQTNYKNNAAQVGASYSYHFK